MIIPIPGGWRGKRKEDELVLPKLPFHSQDNALCPRVQPPLQLPSTYILVQNNLICPGVSYSLLVVSWKQVVSPHLSSGEGANSLFNHIDLESSLNT